MKKISALILILALNACASTTYRGSAIRDHLSETPGLAAHNISIEEEPAGNITLNGSVASNKDRETIEKVARNTRGVENLRSNLVVDSSSIAVHEGYPSSSNDERTIVSDISSEISSSAELRDYRLQVEAAGSEVTLRGEVGNERARTTAEQIARNTRGVSRVRNEITLSRYNRI